MKKQHIIALLFLGVAGASCDDGRLYEEQTAISETGRVVKLTGQLSGINNWAEGYDVVVAGFAKGNEFAIITKDVQTSAGGQVVTIMSGIPDDVTEVELCVTNRLRKRILTFCQADLSNTDTIRLETGTMDVGMYATIQEQLFNTTCVSCHGASTFAGGGLYLTDEKSYDALMGKPSQLQEGMMLVKSGDAESSILFQAIDSDISSAWRQDHSNMVMSSTMKGVVRDWINDVTTSYE